MADVTSEARPAQARGPLFYIGAGALLMAMAVETLAVIGRHIGAPLLGAIEIIQAAILLLASSAMLSATLNDGHATVTLLTHRFGALGRRVLRGFAATVSALFFIALTTGAMWLAVDAWNDHERSELLHIPFRPLRVVSILAALAIACVFVRDVVRSWRRSG